MTINSNSVETATDDVLRTALDGVSGTVFAVGFDDEELTELVEVLRTMSNGPTVRLLVRESVLRRLRRDFVPASMTAELIEAGQLSVRASDEPFANMLLVTEEAVIAVVPTVERVGGLVSTDEEFVESAHERYEVVWESAEEFDLRTPARSRVLDSFAEEFGPEMESDFRVVLGSLENMRDESDVNEVTVSLLVVARHEQLLYDVSRWAEDVGLASRSTFSRMKARFEEQGLIEIEKVPIDVGRPRQRLLLGDERLREAEIEELASVAGDLLLGDSGVAAERLMG